MPEVSPCVYDIFMTTRELLPAIVEENVTGVVYDTFRISALASL